MKEYSDKMHEGIGSRIRRSAMIGVAATSWLLGVDLLTTPLVCIAQQPTTASTSALVFDRVTVIDVEHGTRLANQRVVVIGNRITRVGAVKTVPAPKGARIVDARGKYLIPGLWDAHTHPMFQGPDIFYPLYIANGVTGFRDAGSAVPLDSLRAWRREILAGTRVGPPRQFFSGQSLAGPPPVAEGPGDPCIRSALATSPQTCVTDEADAIHVVDSLKAAGADMVKLRSINSTKLYYAIVKEARRLGLMYGGHIQHGMPILPTEAADSGVTFLDHVNAAGSMDSLCLPTDFYRGADAHASPATVASCRPVAERMARKNTWFVPTANIDVYAEKIRGLRAVRIMDRMREYGNTFWNDSISPGQSASNWFHGPVESDTLDWPSPDSIGFMRIAQRVGLPIVTGTDAFVDFMSDIPPGFGVHAEMVTLVAEGMTPVAALQAATLNPPKAFRMTDSLGTVSTGKLADLVLLDADPLVDISNVTTIRAVVANGRYFDREQLNQLLSKAKAAKANM